MNLAVRGLSPNLGEVPADTFFKDQHPDLKGDYIMANPPFNLKDWRGPDTAMRGSVNLKAVGTPQVTSEARNKLVHDGRWNGYDTPPTSSSRPQKSLRPDG
jgi:type I restriction enzyme M protein